MFHGTDSVFSTQFAQTFLTNPSKRRIYQCKIPTVNTETLIVWTRLYIAVSRFYRLLILMLLNKIELYSIDYMASNTHLKTNNIKKYSIVIQCKKVKRRKRSKKYIYVLIFNSELVTIITVVVLSKRMSNFACVSTLDSRAFDSK
jgi:hypothetical protein